MWNNKINQDYLSGASTLLLRCIKHMDHATLLKCEKELELLRERYRAITCDIYREQVNKDELELDTG